MDVVLEASDEYFFTPYVYPKWWPEDNVFRQFLSLNLIAILGGYVLYFTMAGSSYFFVFDHNLMKHRLFLKNQVKREIMCTVKSVPIMSILSSVLFLLEVQGYSKLYDKVHDSNYGWFAIIGSVVAFIFFTDMCIYWIHRGLHSRILYAPLHKEHHTWKVPTPFASHAFHPVDGFLQSLPYHIYVFIFPIHKYVYLGLFVFVNVWTVSIHDADFRVPSILKPVINGAAHHTDHHLYYTCNYGQFFTLWDKLGGSFRTPSAFLGRSPVDDIKMIATNKKHSSSTNNCSAVATNGIKSDAVKQKTQ